MGISQFIQDAKQICGEKNIFTDRLRILSYGTDASFYRYLPKAVVKASSENEIVRLIKSAGVNKTPVTFRAAGTSLSGQTISDSIIILCAGENFKKFEILDNGNLIKTEPGLIAGQANIRLKKYQRKIGPDPASVNSATIGGIVANNASGMTSGVWHNSYKTIKDLRLILADGFILDTSDENSIADFKFSHSKLIDGLLNLRKRIIDNQEHYNKIEKKYQIKNTTGYGLNSFIDFEDPIEILKHLIVGSEGTLACISGITMKTIPVKKCKSVGLLFFPDLLKACQASVLLNEQKVDAIELIDRQALKAIESNPGIPGFIYTLDKSATALLVEFSADSESEISTFASKLKGLLDVFQPIIPVEFTGDANEIEAVWKVRKGIFPSVGANRKPGTTVVIEDVAFKLNILPEAIGQLRNLLDKYEYTDAVIYGHANDGNVHFIFSEDFNSRVSIGRYRDFMNEVVTLVIDKFDGSLKAEHGTGRNMAPFVANEWGIELYRIMKEVKLLFDSEGIFNPGVLINDDPEVYLKNFKPMPSINPLIDKCIECGFCEINCLSNELAMSSRQRIISYRELKTLPKKQAKAFKKEFVEMAEETCAADGLCALSCPVDIDTGVLIKNFRNEVREKSSNPVALLLSLRLSLLVRVIHLGLGFLSIIASLLREKGMKRIMYVVNIISFNKIPAWHKYFPVSLKFNKRVENTEKATDSVVYFPSCISRSMGPAWENKNEKPQVDITLELLKRAGFKIIYPKGINNLCCGMPWESKGFFKIADNKSTELENALLEASENGKIPVLFDTSPCLYRMQKFLNNRLQIYEPATFALEYLVNKLNINKLNKTVAIHPTCSTTKLGLAQKIIDLGKLCATEVVVPQEVGCCGFAGDKGFSKPEINSWALRNLKLSVSDCGSGYSNSRTCEIGLSKNSGIEYKSILYLLEEASRDVKL